MIADIQKRSVIRDSIKKIHEVTNLLLDLDGKTIERKAINSRDFKLLQWGSRKDMLVMMDLMHENKRFIYIEKI